MTDQHPPMPTPQGTDHDPDEGANEAWEDWWRSATPAEKRAWELGVMNQTLQDRLAATEAERTTARAWSARWKQRAKDYRLSWKLERKARKVLIAAYHEHVVRVETERDQLRQEREGTVDNGLTRTYCHQGHLLTPDNLYKKWSARRQAWDYRCLICTRVANRRASKAYKVRKQEKARQQVVAQSREQTDERTA